MQLRKILLHALALVLIASGYTLAQRVDGGVRVNGAIQGVTFPSITFTNSTVLNDPAGLGQLAMTSSSTTNSLRIPNGSNAEYGGFSWSGNFLNVGVTLNAGTARFSRLASPVGAGWIFSGNGTDVWQIGTNGHFIAVTDNANDVGAAGARVRNVVAGSDVSGNSITAAASGFFQVSSRSTMLSSADKLAQLEDNARATGTEINNGTPTLGTCTGGSLTSGSHNIAGQYTGNTSSSCVINFGTPNFTNTPFCFAMSTASTTHPRISAASASSITVTGGISGETIQYFCIGRIGT